MKIDIILVTFNRKHFLDKVLHSIYERTRTPYRLIVVDNNSTDGTRELLKIRKTEGFLSEVITMDKNVGYGPALNEGLKMVESEFLVTTQDDLEPPLLIPDWLSRLVHYYEKYKDTYCALAMRVERIRHREVDEFEEVIPSAPSLSSVFRIQSTADIKAVGGFTEKKHWESTGFIAKTAPLEKKYGVLTHLYASHIGFMLPNKGYEQGFTDYFTYSPERVNQGEDQPYPEIEPRSNIPTKINNDRDRHEQQKREEYWKYWGMDDRKSDEMTDEQKELSVYAEKGYGLDLGCGKVKCHSNALGMDVFPYEAVDIVGDITKDLWMIRDGELDFIVSSHALEHLPDFVRALEEWRRKLRTGGIMALTASDFGLNPTSILKEGHRTPVSLNVVELVLRKKLNMKIERVETLMKEDDWVFLIVAKKV